MALCVVADESREQDFDEGIIDFPGSGIVDLLDGGGEGLGDRFDFALTVVFFDCIDDAFHNSSVREKRNANSLARLKQ